MTDTELTKPSAAEVSVVVVSDFEGEEKTWSDEIEMLRALAAQDYDRPFRVLVAENETLRDVEKPGALIEAFPGAEIVYYPSDASATLKDHAVSLCDTPWVAVFEADAVPESDWLRVMMDAAKENPQFDVFSGRTWYGDDSSWKRALNLLDRSFDDYGASGKTEHVSNNGALYKTEVLKKFPYPDAATPFLSARKRLANIREAGLKLYFNRDARTRHAIGGMDFVKDVRRNAGYSDMMMCVERRATHMPTLTFKRMRSEGHSLIRVGGQYLKPQDVPVWAAMYLYARIPEWGGMREALKKVDALEGSAYR